MDVSQRLATTGACLALFSSISAAQSPVDVSPGAPVLGEFLSWPVVSRDGCSNLREYDEATTNAGTGQISHRLHQVVEVSSGLNYISDSGAWTPSQDLIELTQDGGAAALRSPVKVRFSPDLAADVALTITVSNQTLRTRPVGIYYVDPVSGTNLLLAAAQENAIAELVPPNRIVYRSAFKSDVIEADWMVTCTMAGVESDIILTRQPKAPSVFGLSSETLLQVQHAWPGAPVPTITQVALEPGVLDQNLHFPGNFWFPTGKAFTANSASPSDTNSPARISFPGTGDSSEETPVVKDYSILGDVGILSESVRWADIAPKLTQLPTSAGLRAAPGKGQLASIPTRSSALPKTAQKSRVQIAKVPYTQKGFLLDYQIVVGGTSYTFNTGTTYVLTNGATFTSVTFNPGAILKYTPGAYLSVAEGTLTCNGSSGSAPVVCTSIYDGSIGEVCAYGDPRRYDRALIVYSINSANVARFKVRWANIGPYFLYSTGGAVQNSFIEQCATGIKAESSSSVTLTSVTNCNVTTSTTVVSSSTISGTAIMDCGAVGTPTLADASQLTGMEGEPCVTINPVNTSNLFVIANSVTGPASPSTVQIWGAYSTNGGANWTASTLPSGLGDGWAAFDCFGNLFACCQSSSAESVIVVLSTNGGA